jgi:hypothetical protein
LNEKEMSDSSSTSKDKKDKPDTYIVYYDVKQRDTIGSTFIALVVIAWIVAGLAAHFTALSCIGGSTFWHNMYGLIIAVLLGPCYFIWLYYMKDKGYCYYGKSS